MVRHTPECACRRASDPTSRTSTWVYMPKQLSPGLLYSSRRPRSRNRRRPRRFMRGTPSRSTPSPATWATGAHIRCHSSPTRYLTLLPPLMVSVASMPPRFAARLLISAVLWPQKTCHRSFLTCRRRLCAAALVWQVKSETRGTRRKPPAPKQVRNRLVGKAELAANNSYVQLICRQTTRAAITYMLLRLKHFGKQRWPQY